jgi:fructoselysine-6-P-deglycase FrlB-like protein
MASTPGAFDPEAPLPGAPEPWRGSTMPLVRSGPPFLMTDMIAAEPAFAGRLLRRLAAADGPAAALAAQLAALAASRERIRVVGCGTSEHGAQATALILGHALGRREGRASPVEAVQAFEAALAPQVGGLVIGISHEGGTWATNRALEAARAAGSHTALITVGHGSPGAALADTVVSTDEMDQSWCHTVGYLSPLLAATAVAGHLLGRHPDPEAVSAALEAGAADSAAAEAGAADLAASTHLLVIASGADRPAARELALKIEEATWLPATMRDLETLLHGHLPATGPETGLVLIMTDGDGLQTRAERAGEALAAAQATGMRAFAILSDDADVALTDVPTPAGRMRAVLPAGLDGPAASLIASAVPVQLFTERLARVRGTNPDPIRRDQAAWREAGRRHR